MVVRVYVSEERVGKEKTYTSYGVSWLEIIGEGRVYARLLLLRGD